LKRAKEGLEETRETFQGLTESLSKESISRWWRLAEEAMAKRGEALNIYQVQQAKGLQSVLIGPNWEADNFWQCRLRPKLG